MYKLFLPNFPLFTLMLSFFGVGLTLLSTIYLADDIFMFLLFSVTSIFMIFYPIYGIISNSFVYNKKKYALLITNQYKNGLTPKFSHISLDNISQVYIGKLKKFSVTHKKEFNTLMLIYRKNFKNSRYGYMGGKIHDNIMNIYMEFFSESIAFIKTKNEELFLLKVDAIDNRSLYQFSTFLRDYGIQDIVFDMKKKTSRSTIINIACYILLSLVYLPLLLNVVNSYIEVK